MYGADHKETLEYEAQKISSFQKNEKAGVLFLFDPTEPLCGGESETQTRKVLCEMSCFEFEATHQMYASIHSYIFSKSFFSKEQAFYQLLPYSKRKQITRRKW